MKRRIDRIACAGAAALMAAALLLSGCGEQQSGNTAPATAAAEAEQGDTAEKSAKLTIEQATPAAEPESEKQGEGAGQPGLAAGTESAGQPGLAAEAENAGQSGSAAEAEGVGQPDKTADSDDGFTFADLKGWEFFFSSGAGAWYTALYINEDGTFSGQFQDSDMGDTGEDYPDGTVYYSEFSGKFTEPEKIDDMTYRLRIESIEYPLGEGDEIIDGIHYYYATAYGLDGAEELLLYLPGTRLADLPEEYRGWVGYYNLDNTKETTLPYYGLYNVTEQEGFSSSNYEAQSMSEQAADEIAAAEERAGELEDLLQAAQTQADMNEISGQIYSEWDNTLNTVWAMLKETLDAEAMETLTAEERAWIAEKEQSVKKAGEESGGTMQPLAQNTRAAEMTKERVYELAKYLK